MKGVLFVCLLRVSIHRRCRMPPRPSRAFKCFVYKRTQISPAIRPGLINQPRDSLIPGTQNTTLRSKPDPCHPSSATCWPQPGNTINGKELRRVQVHILLRYLPTLTDQRYNLSASNTACILPQPPVLGWQIITNCAASPHS